MFYILAALFVVLVPVFLLMTATAAMVLFNRPEGIRPPWWDWGLDKSAEIIQASAIVEKVEVPAKLPEVKVEAVSEVEKKGVKTHSGPKW